MILLDADYCTIKFRSNCHISRIIIGCEGILSCIDCIVGGKVIVWVRVLIYLVTVSWDSSSIMNFHSDVIVEGVPYDVHSSTVLLFFQTRGKDCRSYINGIATEVSHILLKCVFTQDDMWLAASLPIWTINRNSSPKCSYVLSEFAAFDKSEITRTSYID